jgi:hypothetical protein
VAIAGALDIDADFRFRVAEAVSHASPELIGGVRDGAALHVTDPLDAAVVAYLTQPEGWQGVVAEATSRWHAANAPKEAAAEELTRLRAESGELRRQLRAAHAQARHSGPASVVASPADLEAKLAKVTHDLRLRTGELRAVQRERDEALARVAEVEAASAARSAEWEIEVRQLRDRMAEMSRAVEGTRRAARTERELDEIRLRLLVETLTDAAAGIRRELALPASSLRPADVLVSGVDGMASTTVFDAVGLDRLIALPQAHLIVDGYNVTKTGYGELPLVDQRTRLTQSLATLRSRSSVEVTVAFDGGRRPSVPARAPRGVRVLFSAEDEIADDLIRRLVAAEPAGRPLIVVTSDQAIVEDMRAAGAWTAPSAVLLALLA